MFLQFDKKEKASQMENLSDFLSIPNNSINNDPVKEVYSSKVAQDPLVKETLSILEKALDEYG